MTARSSNSVEGRPEILRLARLLRKTPQDLAFLQNVDDTDLRVFRDQVTDTLFDAHTSMLRRLAGAAKLLPAPVTVRIAQKVFGPLLCARIAGELEPGKASEVARRLPVDFLTDLAVELDPRRSQAVISSVPTETIQTVAVELARREDWITLGRFVGFLADEPLGAALEHIGDVEVLRTAFAVDDLSAIATVIDLLGEQRLTGLLRTASEENLWPTLLTVAGHLRDDQVADLAGVLAGLDDSVLDGLVGTVNEHDLWPSLLPLAASLPTDAQLVVADSVGRLAPRARAAVAARAEELGVTDDLGPIGKALAKRAA